MRKISGAVKITALFIFIYIKLLVKLMAIKTPSKSKQETLDNIQMIVGKISESEELTQESVEDIDEKLGKKGLEDLVNLAGGIIHKKAFVLAEADAADREDVIFLATIPVFPHN